MCMIAKQKEMQVVEKPEVCYQIKLKKDNGSITGIFHYSFRDIVEFGKKCVASEAHPIITLDNTVEGGVFHCIKDLEDAKRILNILVASGIRDRFSVFSPVWLGDDVPILVECVGDGKKVIGTMDNMHKDVDGLPCVGYTEITYIKEVEV